MFAGKRPFPFHYYYANKDSFSYPTSRDSPQPQPACDVCRPQLLLLETAVHHPNHSPFPKISTTSPRCNCLTLRQNQIAVLRTGASVPRRKVGRICGSCQNLRQQSCSNFCPPPSKPSAFISRRGFCALCSASLTQRRKGRAPTSVAQNARQRTENLFPDPLDLTNLVFNVQTANFKAGKTFTAKINTSREHCKGDLAFPTQLLRHFPKFCPACLSKIYHASGKNTAQPTSKKHLDGKPALTPPSVALARLTKTFAIHQNTSRPRCRASVNWKAS
jgi:hypothetical protein